jgi:hypothetical protein
MCHGGPEVRLSLGMPNNAKYETRRLHAGPAGSLSSHGWLVEATPVAVTGRLQLKVEVVDQQAIWNELSSV